MRQRAAVLFDVIGAGITGALVGIFAALLIGHETRVRS